MEFEGEQQLPLGHRQRLHRLRSKINKAFVHTLLIPIVKQKYAVSLRIIDWLVVNYSKQKNIKYDLKQNNNKQTIVFDIHCEYKTTLSVWRRRLFDPFQRNQRIYFSVNGKTYSTTVAQIAFLIWADENDVISYACKHFRKIEKNMRETLKKNKKRKGKKRKALTVKHETICSVSNKKIKIYDSDVEES